MINWSAICQNSSSPKDEYYLTFLENARTIMLLLINNIIHDKIMQIWVTRFRHMQSNLFTQLSTLNNNEQSLIRTKEVKQYVLITKIVKITNIPLYIISCTALNLFCTVLH